jgi:hypothetical protein
MSGLDRSAHIYCVSCPIVCINLLLLRLCELQLEISCGYGGEDVVAAAVGEIGESDEWIGSRFLDFLCKVASIASRLVTIGNLWYLWRGKEGEKK